MCTRSSVNTVHFEADAPITVFGLVAPPFPAAFRFAEALEETISQYGVLQRAQRKGFASSLGCHECPHLLQLNVGNFMA